MPWVVVDFGSGTVQHRAGIVVYDTQNPITISGVIVEAAKRYGLFMENGQAEIDRTARRSF